MLVQINIADKDFPFSRYGPGKNEKHYSAHQWFVAGQVKVKEDIEGSTEVLDVPVLKQGCSDDTC